MSVKIEFRPLSESLIPACRAFNERLRSHGEPPFLLPETAPPKQLGAPGGISWTHYVAVDDGGAVRGGVLLMEQRAWIGQRVASVINIQSPLSEGAVDRTYSGVGIQMLGFLTRQSPFLYAVGMGSDRNPFARLLTAAGWLVKPVPFQFSVLRAGRFLREIGPLRQGRRKTLARAAAAGGLGSVALAAWRSIHKRPSSDWCALQSTVSWPDELNLVWNACRDSFDFASLRDARGAADLHPPLQARLKRFLLRADGEILGWSVGIVTAMHGSPHFGDLTVGTILDALAPREHLNVLLALTHDALRDLGAEVIVSNQTHRYWRTRLASLGFLNGPSNYLVAMSKPLASELLGDLGRAYVSRADGDGRIHL